MTKETFLGCGRVLGEAGGTAVALQTLDYRGIAGDGLVGCPVRDLLPGRGGEAGCMDSVLDRIDGRVQF
ncbi:hypothetical protein D8771_03125, partial [Streptomyces albus]